MSNASAHCDMKEAMDSNLLKWSRPSCVTVGHCRENAGGTSNLKPSLLTKHKGESNMETGANAQTQRVDPTAEE